MAKQTVYKFKKVKERSPAPVPRPAQGQTPQAVIRKALAEVGAAPRLRKPQKSIDVLRQLIAGGKRLQALSHDITFGELTQLEADIYAMTGIRPEHGSGTLPERLVAKWLLDNGVPYSGMSYTADTSRGFSFQVPLLGGRASLGGGAVADIFLAASEVGNEQGTAVRVNGAYWHMRSGNAGRDEAQKIALEGAGLNVYDIWDYEVLEPGSLDSKMRQIMASA